MGIIYRTGPDNVPGVVPAVYEVVDDIVVGNGNPIWTLDTTDRSGLTGATVFDFDGDGASEVVYRDETDLRILDGRTGATIFSAPCISGTRWEYPVVADVNSDGNTNIVCACAGVGVQVFQSRNTPWRTARSVWNQHGYNVTNVNDDLTIPAVPRSNTEGFGNIYNNFLQQSISDNDLADRGLEFANASFGTITLENTDNCPDEVTVSIEITNTGLDVLSATMPLTLYANDPTNPDSAVITEISLGQNLAPAQSITLDVPVAHPSPYELFVVLNVRDDIPLPLDYDTLFPVTGVAECDYTDNVTSLAVVCPESCYNGRDDDGDGLTDFDDPDCPCNLIPTVTLTEQDAEVCIDSPAFTFEANLVVGGLADDVNWYDDDTSTIPVQQGGLQFTPGVTAVGTYEYFVEAIETYSDCVSDRVPITLTIYDYPQVSQLDDQIVCDGFTLPTLLANNRYFTQANGQGTELFPRGCGY